MVSSVTGVRIPAQRKRKAGDPQGESTQASQDQEEDTEEDPAKVHPGIAVWVAFSIPDCLTTNVEGLVTQIVQSSCLSPVVCKVI